MRPSSTLHFGPFYLDGTDDGLWRGPQRCQLTAKASAVLRYLVEHPNRLVRRTTLMETVWPDVHVSDWALTTCIREIRHVLGDVAKAPRYIATVHRQGYRFIAPVTVADTPPPLPFSEPPPPPLRSALPAPELSQSPPTAAGLDEELKLVTVLCGALAATPPLATRLGPERQYRLLQTIIGLVQEVLHPYGGTLTLATSAGFTAIFGAPLAQEDHARRAVLAALELRQRLPDFPALRAQLAGAVLAPGMGLHSGLVVVGSLGNNLQRLSTAVGEPLHVATRLQQQAAPGTILLSAATYALVQAEVQAAPCGTLDMDGQPTPMPLYTLQGLLRRHAGVTGRGLRAASPFVGRERELALLHDCLAAVRTGQGQVVGLVGEPGMGKTRLLTEFCRRVAGTQVTVYVGQCLSYGQGTPYLPVRDLVRQICALAEGAELVEDTAAVRLRLHERGITAADDVALLLQLLDRSVAPECLARLSPEVRQVRTFALLRHLVLDAAQRQPLVLVVENLHWSDPTSEEWLGALAAQVEGSAMLLLATYRPGYQLPWLTHSWATQVALPPLNPHDSLAVVQAVPQAAQLPTQQQQAIVTKAAGNPFFLEELAWAAVAHSDDVGPLPLPDTIEAVLAARMDQLPSEEKQLLQTAAVVGTAVPVPLLQTITELPETRLHRCLTQLQAAEFLYETQLFPAQVYAFKHALTHEVAYGSLLQARRRALHVRIVEVLEALAGERVAEVASGRSLDQVELLAHHALRGEVWDKALAYCRQAGDKAVSSSAYREAAGYFVQALEALAHLPTDRTTREQAVDLRLQLCSALTPFARWEQALAHMHEAETIAEELGDHRRLGRVYRSLADTLRHIPDHESALTYCQRAHAIATALGDVETQIWGHLTMGMVYHDLGNYRQGIACLQQMLSALQGRPPDQSSHHVVHPAIQARVWMVNCLMQLGAFADGVAYGHDAGQMAEASGRPFDRLTVYARLGRLYVCQGTLPQAIPLLERAVALSQEANIPVFYRLAAAPLALAYALAGCAADALAVLGQRQMSEKTHHLYVDLACGEAFLRAGCMEEAHRLTQEVLTDASHVKERGWEAWALWLLGEIAIRYGPPDAVLVAAYYQQALALAEALGMRPLQAHCHHGLGRLYAQTSQRELARTALSAAIALYRAMEMTFWLSQAEAVLAQAA